MFHGQPKSIKQKVRTARFIVRVWGWFSSTGGGAIRLIPDLKMGNEDYVTMLEDSFVPEAWSRYGMKPISFLYEKKSFFPNSFSSSVVQSFFKEHAEFQATPWPTKSRDFSPFPMIWSDIERAIQLQRLQPKNQLELFEVIEDLWMNRISRPEFCRGLLDSFKENLQKVLLAEGEWINL